MIPGVNQEEGGHCYQGSQNNGGSQELNFPEMVEDEIQDHHREQRCYKASHQQ